MSSLFTPKSSFRFDNSWSPASRDPRFSRATPDALRARIEAAISTGDPPVRKRSWAADIVHAKARKTPKYDPVRVRLIEQMKTMAETAEKKRVDATREVDLASPSPAVPASRPETAACEPPQRAVFERAVFGSDVGSPVPPLGPLA